MLLPLPADITRTILGNLIENSFQHGATEITVEASQTADTVLLTVTDNGRGISPANAEKLFTPFFTTKREQGGTGLGLVVIRSLLAAYRGEIRCIPKTSGACFEIVLPVA
jgi:signal transduction histidine kinase